MAKTSSDGNRIMNGAVLPSGGGNVKIELQGFTRGSFGAETFEDRIAPDPVNEDLL